MDLRWLGNFDRVYCYCRVSSTEQSEKRQSIEVQENRLKSILPQPDRIYKDVMGGDERGRPDYEALLDQVRVDAVAGLKVLVVITEQSRLSREGSDRVTALIELFDALGVCLYALDGGRQTVAEPHEWLMRSQEAIFNQYFLRQLRRNLRSVKAQRRLEGKPLNPSPPFGYKWSREKYLRDEQKWGLALEAVRKYLPPPAGEGWSLARCAEWARENGWRITHNGFRKWLLNPVLEGDLENYEKGLSREEQKKDREARRRGEALPSRPKRIIYGAHEALITREQKALILSRLKENFQYARLGTQQARYPLSGLIYCGACQKKMVRHATIDKRYGRHYGYYCCRNPECSGMRAISERKLEKALRQEISLHSDRLAEMAARSAESGKESPELIEVRQQLEQMRALYQKTPLSGLREAIAELEQRVETLEGLSQRSISVDLLALAQQLSDPENYKLLTPVERRQDFHRLCHRVEVCRTELRITLSF